MRKEFRLATVVLLSLALALSFLSCSKKAEAATQTELEEKVRALEAALANQDRLETRIKALEEALDEANRKPAELTPGQEKAVTEAAEKAAQKATPKWVKNWTLFGDMRLRYQGEDTEGKTTRHRGRIRFRTGAKVEVAGGVEAGFRLASGGSDPRSTNQTLGDFFDTPDFRLDRAYLKWEPRDFIYVVGGKFKNLLWTPSDLLWDGDINPEGAAAHLAFGPFFANLGFFILNEHSGDSNDPFMVALQPGAKFKAGIMDFKLAATGYWFSDITKSPLEYSEETNTRKDDGSDTLLYEFNSVSVGAEMGLNFKGPVERVAVFGEGIYNPDPEDNEYGWLGGFKFGSKKVKEFGQWQAKYMYRRLEKDAWLDTFPDSDFFNGKTGVQGHEIVLTFGLTKNFSLGIDYYNVEDIDDSDKDQQLLQVDLVAKF